MKSRMFIVALTWMALPLFAHASCDSVKTDIDAKIKANGVGAYRLEVVSTNQADNSRGKVVGQCEGDKTIVYSRGQSNPVGDNSNSTPKESPVEAGHSPDNAQKPKSPVVARSGQTGG